jgi:hypothetical protein
MNRDGKQNSASAAWSGRVLVTVTYLMLAGLLVATALSCQQTWQMWQEQLWDHSDSTLDPHAMFLVPLAVFSALTWLAVASAARVGKLSRWWWVVPAIALVSVLVTYVLHTPSPSTKGG